MNIDLLAANPAWWWYAVFATGILGLTIAVWAIFKRCQHVGASYLSHIDKATVADMTVHSWKKELRILLLG